MKYFLKLPHWNHRYFLAEIRDTCAALLEGVIAAQKSGFATGGMNTDSSDIPASQASA